MQPIFLLQYHYYYNAGARRNQEFHGSAAPYFGPLDAGYICLPSFFGEIDFPKDLP
jgi:hypothetical protein